MPEHLPREHIKQKQIIAQRKNVHSYIYPSKFELLRHEMKQKVRDKMSYHVAGKGPAPSKSTQPRHNNSLETLQDYEHSLGEGATLS